ncbi:pro-sigmaK processing inhibitor BofA family protein [Allofournierella sp.]|uniref:pro-sigmaK processing inhibitor BofA family protein n=1 Tax=Allofournierella sp. TaxID=1940256 RepID=UPI002E766D2D|nr:pro-sigmaK processing inhibitor BofA family protein [Fournierella sp.]MEE0757280.1 pro-sigmaK processing inhibitor BofA family protein [Fournierella sp.]
MSGAPWPVWAAAAAVLLVVGLAAARHRRPGGAALSSAVAGVAALGAVNMLAPFTGVGLALNWFTSFAAVVLGVPGVICLLAMRLIFQT